MTITELRKYILHAKDWHLISTDAIFKATRERLRKGNYEYPYLVFDYDEWTGTNYAKRCEFIGNEYRDRETAIYECNNDTTNK